MDISSSQAYVITVGHTKPYNTPYDRQAASAARTWANDHEVEGSDAKAKETTTRPSAVVILESAIVVHVVWLIRVANEIIRQLPNVLEVFRKLPVRWQMSPHCLEPGNWAT
jgi:hypothetical protein